MQEAVKLDGAIFGGLLEKSAPHIAKHMVGILHSICYINDNLSHSIFLSMNYAQARNNVSKRKKLIIFGCDFDQVLFVKRIEKPKRTC